MDENLSTNLKADKVGKTYSALFLNIVFVMGMVGALIVALLDISLENGVFKEISLDGSTLIVINIVGTALLYFAYFIFMILTGQKISNESLSSAPASMYIITSVFFLLGILMGFTNPYEEDVTAVASVGAVSLIIGMILLLIIGILNIRTSESKKLGIAIVIGLILAFVGPLIVDTWNIHGKAAGIAIIIGDYMILNGFKAFLQNRQ